MGTVIRTTWDGKLQSHSILIIFRSGRISSVYIVGCGLWVVGCHTFSKLVNFECVGMLECVLVLWCAVVLECVGVLGSVGAFGALEAFEIGRASDWKSVKFAECRIERV